ncbi:MAG: MIP family channel protein [Bacteroidales bacterium]|jgi:aquaporin Z|nr:MIP family channel protein [Bacteroidales bacterium]
MKKYLSEMIGTMVLVLMGCGSAIFNQGCETPAQVLMVAVAFGLSVVAMAYTIGKISGCHINPAITLGMLVAKKISGKDAAMYMIFQVIGALIGSFILFALTRNFTTNATLTGANAFGEGQMMMAFLAEFVFTCVFVLVVLGTTSKGAENNFAGLIIGLTLILVHIVCIPITGTSVNPARSIGPAVFEMLEGNFEAIKQIWLFILAPFCGAILAAGIWKVIDVKK